jgi:hypothetical protein
MITVVLSFVAAALAVGAEYLYRTLRGPWWHWLWLWVPMQLGIGYCIYRIVTVPGVPLVGALVMWSFAIIGTRVLVSVFILRDVISIGTWAALGLMVAARIAQSVWR